MIVASVLSATFVLFVCLGCVCFALGADTNKIERQTEETRPSQQQLDNLNSTLTEPTNLNKTEIPNPAYMNIAPCPCDLTPGACDINCCCDKECRADDLQTFGCFPGFFGGYQDAEFETFCNSTYHYYKPGWFPMTCIVGGNTGTGFLGQFYYPVDFLQPPSNYSAKFAYNESQCIFPGEPNTCTKSYLPTGYKQGLAVKTGLLATPNDNLTDAQRTGPNYILSLPRRGVSGRCNRLAPVQFLIDSEDICDVEVTEQSCTENPQLSALFYAQIGPLVLEQQNVSKIASTNVIFRCVGNVTTSQYVKSKQSYAEKVPSNSASYFGTNNTSFADTVTICPWDDGFATTPPTPSLNSTCDNVVVSVQYNFTWTGQTIVSFDATIVLGNVTLTENFTGNASAATVTQKFTAVFVGNTTETTTNSTNTTSATGDTNSTSWDSNFFLPLSGNPGYNKGLPVISGLSVSVANSSDNFTSIDANVGMRLALFKTDSSGLCASADRKDLLFALNELAQCQLRLLYNDFHDCSNLRNMTLKALASLMPSNYISIIGNPDTRNMSHWLSILRQDVPHLFANATENVTADGVCRDVPSAINADILYAEVGQSNYHPIYMIVGARINYSLSNWTLYCSGVGALSCSHSQSIARGFTVSSSVRFIQVPATTQPAPTVHERQTYRRPYTGASDVSWTEFFYPFMAINRGMNQQLSLAIALAISVFIVVLATLLVMCGN